MLTLYEAEWCYYCARVRAKIVELGVDYTSIEVQPSKSERTELIKASGQAGIPTLVTEEGLVIADNDDAIIAYLEERFG